MSCAAAATVALAVVMAGCAASSTNHGDPDPGRRVLTTLESVERAVPAHAQVIGRQGGEPIWDSCDGRPGTFGWDDIVVDVEFTTGEEPRRLLAQADTVLTHEGWKLANASTSPLGPGARWTRPITGSTVATVSLNPGTAGAGAEASWDLHAFAPPKGQRSSGC
jgi:hypothetical protein